MGMFRPDGDAKPRWRGNLKQYQFGLDAHRQRCRWSIATGTPAISASTGFISPNAVVVLDRAEHVLEQPAARHAAVGSDSPDGEVVEKGATAQRTARGLRDRAGPRAASSPASAARRHAARRQRRDALRQRATRSITDSDARRHDGADRASRPDRLGARHRQRRRRARAATSRDDGASPVHGDVLHSRPAVVNYGGSTGVGRVLRRQRRHAARRQRQPDRHRRRARSCGASCPRRCSASSTGCATTRRRSACPARRRPRRRRRATTSSTARSASTRSSTPTAASSRRSSTSRMRRGGRLLYAFDVTDPAAPTLLWRKTERRHSAARPDLVGAAAWRASRATPNPVIVFGARLRRRGRGRDHARARRRWATRSSCSTRSPAALLKTFADRRAVPADVALIDSDFDGYIDRAYARRSGRQGVSASTSRRGRRQLADRLDDLQARRSLAAAPAPAASSSSGPTSS